MKKAAALFLLFALLAGCTQTPLKQEDENDVNAIADANQQLDTNAVDSNQQADLNAPADQNIPKRKNAQLFVFVKDEKDRVMAGAKVSVNGAEQGLTYSDSNNSDENGFILFTVPEGNYRVVVEKEGFLTNTADKNTDSRVQNILGISLEKIPPEFQPIKWGKTLNDGTISIDPAGFLLAKRGERRLVLNISGDGQGGDFIGELGNKAFEWRMKIIEGTSTGFAVSVELFTPTKKLVKIQHSIDRVNLVGSDITKVNVDLKADYHTFKLVVNSEEKATLFLDGKEVVSNKSLSGGLPVADPKRLFFESFKGITSIDYFYVDLDNDGKWDYREEWDSLDNVT